MSLKIIWSYAYRKPHEFANQGENFLSITKCWLGMLLSHCFPTHQSSLKNASFL